MTKEEFVSRQTELSNKFEEDLLNLERECARENNKVKIGDVVSDGIKTIIVDKFILHRASRYGYGFPYYDYYGRMLTKQGKPRKDGTSCSIYVEFLKTINGKEVGHED